MKKILKESTVNIRAKEGSSPNIKLEVLDNTIAYEGLNPHCGCTSIQITDTHYIINIDRLEDVRHMVNFPDTQKEYVKIVIFDIIHLNAPLETVTINITVYDDDKTPV